MDLYPIRLDFILLPILCLGLFALQLDKGNISYIITTTFTDDIGITTDNVNYGNQLMLAALVAFEIHSTWCFLVSVRRYG